MRLPSVLAVCVIASSASAAEYEITLRLAPTYALMETADDIAYGGGVMLSGAFGFTDWLTLEGEVLCNRYSDILATRKDDKIELQDLTSCSVGPLLLLSLKTPVLLTVATGPTVQLETRSGRILIEEATVAGSLDATNDFRLRWVTRVEGSYRFWDHFAAGLFARWEPPTLSISMGAFLGLMFYP